MHLARGALSQMFLCVFWRQRARVGPVGVDECGQESLVRDMNSMVLILHLLVAS